MSKYPLEELKTIKKNRPSYVTEGKRRVWPSSNVAGGNEGCKGACNEEGRDI